MANISRHRFSPRPLSCEELETRLCLSGVPQVVAGDSSGDLQFDQRDILHVLQAEKYLSGEPATFEEGDWNGDGVFDQTDIVSELVATTYDGNSAAALGWRDGQSLTFDETGVALRYRLYPVPTHDNGDQKMPLILNLHNWSGSGENNVAHVTQTMFRGLLAATQTEQFASFLLAPQISQQEAIGGGWESPEILNATLALVDEVIATYNIDPQRVYVTGKSMGGYGTYATIRARPDFFAAAVPIASSSSSFRPEAAELIKDVPIWIFHGTADTVVPVSQSHRIVEALREAGGVPRYTETDFDHNSWGAIFSDQGQIFTDSSSEELFQWLFSQSLPSVPEPIVGDANGDGVFNQHDIQRVLQAGKFLTGEPADFAIGDWNQDGTFDQLDIVAVLQTGNYEVR